MNLRASPFGARARATLLQHDLQDCCFFPLFSLLCRPSSMRDNVLQCVCACVRLCVEARKFRARLHIHRGGKTEENKKRKKKKKTHGVSRKIVGENFALGRTNISARSIFLSPANFNEYGDALLWYGTQCILFSFVFPIFWWKCKCIPECIYGMCAREREYRIAINFCKSLERGSVTYKSKREGRWFDYSLIEESVMFYSWERKRGKSATSLSADNKIICPI